MLGFHKDGLRITTAVRLFKLLVRPLLEYGAQFLPYNNTQIAELETFQCSALRTLMGLFPNVKAETVRLLSGVEPIACRMASLKVKCFHRLVTSEKPLFKNLLKHQLNNLQLVRCFEIKKKHKVSEWVKICLDSFGGVVSNIFSRHGIFEDFKNNSDLSRSEFSSKVKRIFRKHYFDLDLSAFDSTVQGDLFKKVCLPVLRASKPYSGVAINPVVFKNATRANRTAFLQALSGAHFAKEKLLRKHPRRKCAHSVRLPPGHWRIF